MLTVSIAIFVPAASFLFHADGFHRLLQLTCFPLSFLVLAYLLVADFPTYATDQKMERRTLLTRLGWQRAIPLHHVLVLAAFLIFASSPFFGIPGRLIWLVFLDVPLPMLQQRIRNMDSRGQVIDPGETFADLYARRLPLYRHFAELTIPCGDLTPEEIAAAIEGALCGTTN